MTDDFQKPTENPPAQSGPPSDFWETRYGAEGFAYGREPNDFIREMSTRLSDGPALCLASGEGRNAVFLASVPQVTSVLAIDRAREGGRKTLALAQHAGVEVQIQQADLAEHDLGQSVFSTITSVFAHMPPEIRRALHRKVVAALKPGGHFVLEAYTPDQVGRGTGGPPNAAMMMTLEGLKEELDGLVFVVGRECERDVQEGQYHTGWSSTVQVLARKP